MIYVKTTTKICSELRLVVYFETSSAQGRIDDV